MKKNQMWLRRGSVDHDFIRDLPTTRTYVVHDVYVYWCAQHLDQFCIAVSYSTGPGDWTQVHWTGHTRIQDGG